LSGVGFISYLWLVDTYVNLNKGDDMEKWFVIMDEFDVGVEFDSWEEASEYIRELRDANARIVGPGCDPNQ
jgi:hypothetical protein